MRQDSASFFTSHVQFRDLTRPAPCRLWVVNFVTSSSFNHTAFRRAYRTYLSARRRDLLAKDGAAHPISTQLERKHRIERAAYADVKAMTVAR